MKTTRGFGELYNVAAVSRAAMGIPPPFRDAANAAEGYGNTLPAGGVMDGEA